MIRLVSLNEEWIQRMSELTASDPKIQCSVQDITTLNPYRLIFVSPANSLGFMDGGFDYALSRKMFPNIESKVKAKIASLGYLTTGGRPYLPVGSATYVEVDTVGGIPQLPIRESTQAGLIVAPTMFLPQDVRNTRNTYYSVYAALCLWEHLKTRQDIVLTSHCCGVGCMSAEESAKQTLDAILDWRLKKGPELLHRMQDTLIFENRDLEQPDVYMNLEVKEIHISKTEAIQRMCKISRST